jgi:histidinol-phosphatase
MPSGHKTSGHIDDVRLAHLLADDADSLSMNRFRAQNLQVDTKADDTWVSDADTSVEEAVRRTLSRARPRDAVVGEEQGNTGWGPRRWVIDPIDGTSNFVRGVPVWATLIGLMVEDEVVAGVVSAPALGRRWWASKGDGAFAGKGLMNAQPCRVSSIDTLARAQVSYSSLNGWQEAGRLVPFLDLLRRCWRTRGFGDFWSYMLLAEGAVDIAAEPELKLHDMAALDVIVTEAGGRFTGLNGVDGPNSGNAAATNGPLHDAVLDLIGDPDRGARDDDDEDLPDAP